MCPDYPRDNNNNNDTKTQQTKTNGPTPSDNIKAGQGDEGGWSLHDDLIDFLDI